MRLLSIIVALSALGFVLGQPLPGGPNPFAPNPLAGVNPNIPIGANPNIPIGVNPMFAANPNFPVGNVGINPYAQQLTPFQQGMALGAQAFQGGLNLASQYLGGIPTQQMLQQQQQAGLPIYQQHVLGVTGVPNNPNMMMNSPVSNVPYMNNMNVPLSGAPNNIPANILPTQIQPTQVQTLPVQNLPFGSNIPPVNLGNIGFNNAIPNPPVGGVGNNNNNPNIPPGINLGNIGNLPTPMNIASANPTTPPMAPPVPNQPNTPVSGSNPNRK